MPLARTERRRKGQETHAYPVMQGMVWVSIKLGKTINGRSLDDVRIMVQEGAQLPRETAPERCLSCDDVFETAKHLPKVSKEAIAASVGDASAEGVQPG